MASTLRRSAYQAAKRSNIPAMQAVRHSSSEQKILTSVYKDLPKVNYTINDFIWQNLDRWPDKTATVSTYFLILPTNLTHGCGWCRSGVWQTLGESLSWGMSFC